MRRCGIAIEIDFQERDKQPCLVNLAADPLLSGTLLYLIPPGLVRIGKNSGPETLSENLDIMLDGPLVRALHWLVMDCVCAFVFLCLGKIEEGRKEDGSIWEKRRYFFLILLSFLSNVYFKCIMNMFSVSY